MFENQRIVGWIFPFQSKPVLADHTAVGGTAGSQVDVQQSQQA